MSLYRYPLHPENLDGICTTDHERRALCHWVNMAFVDGYRTAKATKPKDLERHWVGDLATGGDADEREAYRKRDKLLDMLDDKDRTPERDGI